MDPTLRDGDWLLVDPYAFRRSAPIVGQLVVANDPRDLGRSVIKRIQAVGPDGRLTLAGDHPAHLEDGLGVAATEINGRPWFRYWPPRRLGRIS
jgi:signal peptidase I